MNQSNESVIYCSPGLYHLWQVSGWTLAEFEYRLSSIMNNAFVRYQIDEWNQFFNPYQ